MQHAGRSYRVAGPGHVFGRSILVIGVVLAGCTQSVSTPSSRSLETGAGGKPPAQLSSPSTTAPNSQDWLTYHNDSARTGVGPSSPVVDRLQPAWTSDLDGQVYAEPLVTGDLVIALTENDTVYALDLASGVIRWSQHRGEPVPLVE